MLVQIFSSSNISAFFSSFNISIFFFKIPSHGVNRMLLKKNIFWTSFHSFFHCKGRKKYFPAFHSELKLHSTHGVLYWKIFSIRESCNFKVIFNHYHWCLRPASAAQRREGRGARGLREARILDHWKTTLHFKTPNRQRHSSRGGGKSQLPPETEQIPPPGNHKEASHERLEMKG